MEIRHIEQVVDVTVTEERHEIKLVEQAVEVRHFDELRVVTIDGNTATVTAAEALGGHRVVTVAGNYASKDNAADKFKILGVTQGAVSNGATATVTTYGTMTESSWNWTEGSPVFLSTNGLLTQTPPTSGFRIIIGRPQTATTLFVDISEPIIIL